MTNRLYALIALIPILSACASSASADGNTGQRWTMYACTDGRAVQAAYPDTRTALIKINGQPHTLTAAISADGVRYIGDGWQWWTKGMREGTLAPLANGERIASAAVVTCHAP